MELRPEEISRIIRSQIKHYEAKINQSETGTVILIGDGIAKAAGLTGCMVNELLEFPGGVYGMAQNLEENSVSIVMLGNEEGIREGDTVRRTGLLPGGLQPSVNRILPYASPEFGPMDGRTAWELSLCCLENARDILLALETEFRSLYARTLTLNRLGEAVILPLCPDKGGCIAYDASRAASACLEGDIEVLKRMRPAD